MTPKPRPLPIISALGAPHCIREHLEADTDALHCIGCARKAWPVGTEFLAIHWRFGQRAAFVSLETGDARMIEDAHAATDEPVLFVLNTPDDLVTLAGDGTERECYQCGREL